MGSIADQINGKADKKEVKQQIELVRKDIIPIEKVEFKIKSAIETHEEKEKVRYEGIEKMFKTIIDNQDKMFKIQDDRLTRLENKNSK